MKKLLILLSVFIFVGNAYGDWYTVDLDNNVVVKSNYRPDQADLDSRNEIAIFLTEDIPLQEAEYRGGNVVRHVKTGQEIAAEAQEQARKNQAVADTATARAKLITLGFTPDEADLLLK